MSREIPQDRWREISELYHAALGREGDREAFLAHACAGDAVLRREVESLLAQPASAEAFLAKQAMAFAPQLVSDPGRSLPSGHRIGAYLVQTLVGAGGMGEVYRARDTKLGRDVAIKILPRAFTADPERLTRFEREARMLASLNHPNIGSIYGLEETDGVRALVLELVEGPTLADRLAKGPIPLAEALSIARQMADALDAAHEKGIVHRDLKPANIKITPNGLVKVLDFGLAKAVVGDQATPDLTQSPTVTVGGTRHGTILGTAAYMSPEQARGQAVDKRTDIWAFGCVLYEMLTGRAAFARATITDTLAAVIDHHPNWSALPSSTPPVIARLLEHCLDKDPKRRLRDIGDARTEIDDTPRERQPAGAAQPMSSGRRAPFWLGVAAALLLVGVVSILYFGRRLEPTEQPAPGDTRIEQLTRDSGLTTMPALSSDGRLVAYASDRGGRDNLDIWVQQIAGGEPLQLTADDADDQMPDFSPDGSQIAFRSERGKGGVYIVSALGGPARLVADGGQWPRFSPDGRQIAYWVGQWRGTPSALATASFVQSLSGGAPQPILAEFAMARDPRWAPDGRSLLVIARHDAQEPLAQSFDWWWVPLDGRPPVKSGILDLMDLRKETDAEVVTAGPWTDEGLMLAARGSLWLVPVSSTTGRVSGMPRQLTLGAGGVYRYPSVSQGGQVVFNVTSLTRTVERASVVDQTALPTILYSENGSGASRPSQTSDGGSVLFVQSTSQFGEIWLRDARSGQQRMVVQLDRRNVPLGLSPVLSPDAIRIAYTVEREPDVGTGFIVDAAGGVPRQICDDCGVHGFLSDSRHVLIVANVSHDLRLLDVTSGSVQPLLGIQEGQLDRPHASPDGRWVAVRLVIGTMAKVYVAPLAPGHPPAFDQWVRVNEPTTTPRPAGWSPDGRVLYLLLDTDGFRCLWGQRVDPSSGRLIGTPYAVRHFHSNIRQQFSNSYGNAFTADTFLYGGSRENGNLWRLIVNGS